MGFLITTLVTAASLGVADYFLEGISFAAPEYSTDYWIQLGLAAIALGLLNAVVKPILLMLSMPITCLTLGLFILVLNGLILVLLSLIPFVGFRVDDFLSAIIGALVVGITSFVLNQFVPK